MFLIRPLFLALQKVKISESETISVSEILNFGEFLQQNSPIYIACTRSCC